MGQELLESTSSVPGEAVGEKPPASATADVTTKEEQAEQDAKLRPEREAGFKDYIVRAAPVSSL